MRQAHSYSSVLDDSITSRFEPMESRLLPVNMASSRFYLPSLPTVPVFPCSPYYGGFVRPEMSFPHQGKDIRVLPGYMSHCYHPALQDISYHGIDEEKPTQSYIGLIGKAILSSPQQKLVLGDIYSYILTNYPYFRNKGPGWRNSIRHNLSLNDCFVKMGRSPNGKGHFWAIHPTNYDDFSRGEFKRKRAPRRNRKRSKTEKCSETRKTTTKWDEMVTTNKDVGKCTVREMHSYTMDCSPNGFHIETLLSNSSKGNSGVHVTTPALAVLS